LRPRGENAGRLHGRAHARAPGRRRGRRRGGCARGGALPRPHPRGGRAPLLIAQLRGRILRKEPQELVVDVGGVGYRVTIPLSTFSRLGDPGTDATLLTYTHVREDALALFGFLTPGEQTLFEKLIGVAGVGPKLAINILSGIEAPELVAALRSSDLA